MKMKKKGIGHIKTRLFKVKPSKDVGFGTSWKLCDMNSYYDMKLMFFECI